MQGKAGRENGCTLKKVRIIPFKVKNLKMLCGAFPALLGGTNQQSLQLQLQPVCLVLKQAEQQEEVYRGIKLWGTKKNSLLFLCPAPLVSCAPRHLLVLVDLEKGCKANKYAINTHNTIAYLFAVQPFSRSTRTKRCRGHKKQEARAQEQQWVLFSLLKA